MTFMRTGWMPNACAMVGKAVAITVESRFCMKSAHATMTAVRRVRPLVPAATRTELTAESAGCSDIGSIVAVGRCGEKPLRRQDRSAIDPVQVAGARKAGFEGFARAVSEDIARRASGRATRMRNQQTTSLFRVLGRRASLTYR